MGMGGGALQGEGVSALGTQHWVGTDALPFCGGVVLGKGDWAHPVEVAVLSRHRGRMHCPWCCPCPCPCSCPAHAVPPPTSLPW